MCKDTIELNLWYTGAMNKIINLFLLIIEGILAVTFAYLTTVLPSHPNPFFLQTGELLVLLLLFLCFGLNIHFLVQKLRFNQLMRVCVSTGVLSLALILGAQISHPSFEMRADAQDMTKNEAKAVERGIQLGAEIVEEKISPEQATTQINEQIPEPESKAIANQAVDLKKQGKTDDEIKKALAPTIPLQIGKWNCVAIGCSFADDFNTWTISTQSRWYGLGFTAISLALLLLILNRDLVEIPTKKK